jgi:Fe(3+) dicitrate transport protein
MKRHRISNRVIIKQLMFLAFAVGSLGIGMAQEPEPAVVERMSTVTVEADYDREVEGPFLPDVEGTRINAGKKTSSIDLRELPEISNDNYRQVIATTPGLVLAEESTPLLSIGYRGFEPHRMQYFQVLEDGIPIHADMIGYPEAYYTPPLDAVERVEFVRGGAALMYGPQPAGAINFVMKKPPTDTPFEFETMNLIGSFNYYSNFTSFGGTAGRLGYYGWYNHRQTDGFREANSDFFLNAWSGTFALDATSDRRWYLNVTAYDEVHGEPGGLTLADGPNTVNYDKNRNATSRFFDRMRVSRYSLALIHEWDISDRTLFTFRGWWDYYLRYSRRQRGGGFGTLPTGPAAQTNSIETQQFYTFGIEPRIRHDWDWLDQTHTLTGGMMLYNTYSPRTDGRGNSPTAMQGRVLNQSNRYTWYYSIFAENKFQIGNLSITPGVRLESIWQSVAETKNVARTAAGLPLQDETLFNFVPLFGLGLEYKFTPLVAAYANVSQAYRPPIFTQAVPTGPNVAVDGNLQESFVWNYEVGFRGDPTNWITWDTSLWAIDSSDQIGTRTADNGNLTIIENAGRSFTYGWDFSLNLDLVGLADAIFNQPEVAPGAANDGKSFKSEVDVVNMHRSLVDTYGSLSVFNALTLMKGEFIGGPNEGNTPQYTPDYVYRVGLIYNWRDKLKLAFLGNFNGSSYADDTNTPSRFIPAYDVWDLTIEAKVYRDNVSVIGGVNNIFDADYYARIRPDGIDPALPRNWYAGLKVEF